ncbi:Lrp/AsnC family transcriptional regulator [Candidatus Methylacidiphilum infernorum]|uniref:Lrp/AsnC family transcriptional regulator n=1 Tax=Candidatus Methylacidiphilum infernorum TaxID=511746 RepID=A0ABX7PU27_9BACT|nr:Lrp/AsnC family transcriptional regulator [Candidatus Methylacidiphilum infernorum]
MVNPLNIKPQLLNDIVRLLESNARLDVADMASALGISVDEAARLLADLEKEKFILAYKTIFDPEKIQRKPVRAVIEVKITPERGGGFDKLSRRIAGFEEVTSCFLMSGAYDLLVFLEGESLKEVALFVSEKLATLPGVISTATHFMLKTYKEQGIIFSAPTHSRLPISP